MRNLLESLFFARACRLASGMSPGLLFHVVLLGIFLFVRACIFLSECEFGAVWY